MRFSAIVEKIDKHKNISYQEVDKEIRIVTPVEFLHILMKVDRFLAMSNLEICQTKISKKLE